MNKILNVIKWMFVLPVFGIEQIIKAITFVVLVLCLIIMAILFPVFRELWKYIDNTGFYRYAMKWRGNYPITAKVYDLWSL